MRGLGPVPGAGAYMHCRHRAMLCAWHRRGQQWQSSLSGPALASALRRAISSIARLPSHAVIRPVHPWLRPISSTLENPRRAQWNEHKSAECASVK